LAGITAYFHIVVIIVTNTTTTTTTTTAIIIIIIIIMFVIGDLQTLFLTFVGGHVYDASVPSCRCLVVMVHW
jgi:hypothetical protein